MKPIALSRYLIEAQHQGHINADLRLLLLPGGFLVLGKVEALFGGEAAIHDPDQPGPEGHVRNG